MTPDGTLYSLTPGGALCSRLVLFTIFIQQTPFRGDSTFSQWNNIGIVILEYILVWIVYMKTCFKLLDKRSLTFQIASDIDDEIALAHNLAERQSCHDCHPPAPPSCCHPGQGKPESFCHPQAPGGQGKPDNNASVSHRPVFHGWQQQMRRAAKQHNCVKGKHTAAM